MDYRKWRDAVTVLLEEYLNELLEGNTIYIPHALGRLTLCKYKSKKAKLDFDHYHKTGEKIFHDNSHTDGYYPILYWNYRYNTHANFKYKRHWSVTFVDPVWDKISKKLQEDFTLINNFQKL